MAEYCCFICNEKSVLDISVARGRISTAFLLRSTTWNAVWAFSQSFSRPAKSHSDGKSLTSFLFLIASDEDGDKMLLNGAEWQDPINSAAGAEDKAATLSVAAANPRQPSLFVCLKKAFLGWCTNQVINSLLYFSTVYKTVVLLYLLDLICLGKRLNLSIIFLVNPSIISTFLHIFWSFHICAKLSYPESPDYVLKQHCLSAFTWKKIHKQDQNQFSLHKTFIFCFDSHQRGTDISTCIHP